MARPKDNAETQSAQRCAEARAGVISAFAGYGCENEGGSQKKCAGNSEPIPAKGLSRIPKSEEYPVKGVTGAGLKRVCAAEEEVKGLKGARRETGRMCLIDTRLIIC